MPQTTKPKLRLLDFQPVHHNGEQMWLLRDPWRLSDQQLVVPGAMAQLLLLCDGTRTTDEIRETFAEQWGEEVPTEIIDDALSMLDGSYLLENERYEAARRDTLADYRAQPHRPPALAGPGYPADPAELTKYLTQWYLTPPDEEWIGRGIVSPHIDYRRGGGIYARLWNQAAPSILAADLVLIFGTDHNGSPGSITLTPKPYATPFGVLPTDEALIERLAEAIGPEAAYAEELNHRNEHSVELSAVWLHHIYNKHGQAPSPMIPILVGSFQHFLDNGAHPADDPMFNRFLAALREQTRGRRVLAVGSVDLAHVGPVFGDKFNMQNIDRRERLRDEDKRLMSAVMRGDAADLFQQIASVNDRNRICGFAPLYLMLSFLDVQRGIEVEYDQCEAEAHGYSLVSICGLLLD